MRIEVAVMMQVQAPDYTDLDSLNLQIDEDGGIQFVSNGQVVADASHIETITLTRLAAMRTAGAKTKMRTKKTRINRTMETALPWLLR